MGPLIHIEDRAGSLPARSGNLKPDVDGRYLVAFAILRKRRDGDVHPRNLS